MSNIFSIHNLSKKYVNEDLIFQNFNYAFGEKGFYVLFGQSGCGKTTLLNILYGLEEFNSGKIGFLGKTYENIIDTERASKYIAYLTQENYFIDYLTVDDNIKLCSNNKEEIIRLLDKFKLSDKLEQYPKQLSGGEKQRLSLLISLLKNKKIILLDEPTAALDYENKKIIFELLAELKKDVLVICSSHDSMVFDYCDVVVNFSELSNYDQKQINETVVLGSQENYNVKKLSSYMIKQKDKKTIRGKILVFVIFLISFMLCYFCFDINGKLISTIQNKYKVNYLTIYCPIKSPEKCEHLFKNKHVLEYDYAYSLNVPININPSGDEGFVGNLSFDASLITLPKEKNNFSLLNKISYGEYFKNENDIILGSNLATDLFDIDKESIIGKNIELVLPDGKYVFNVVGIFDEFDSTDTKYFQSGEIDVDSINNKYFISGQFTERYLFDDIKGYNEVNNSKLVYYVYFDDFNALYNINKKYNENRINENKIYVSSFPNQYIEFMNQFKTLSLFIYPILFFSIIIAIIFYYQTMILDINYNIHIISVYQFYGYSLNKIKKGLIISNLISISKCYFYSLISSVFISQILNIINSKFSFFSFQLFNINISIIIIVYIIVIIVSMLLSLKLSRNIKSKGWYKLVKNGGDLI